VTLTSALFWMAAAAIRIHTLASSDAGRHPGWQQVWRLFLIIALLTQTMVLGRAIYGDEGVNLAFPLIMLASLWLATLWVLVREQSGADDRLMVILAPLNGLMLLAWYFWPLSDPHPLPDPGMRAHVLLSIGAWCALLLAMLQALIFWFSHWHLRNRAITGLLKALPPLQTLERHLFELISSGFILLTLSLLSGWVYVDDLFAQHLVHKTVLSVFAWCIFGTLLWGHIRYGWRGNLAVTWTFAGAFMLMLAYFGVQYIQYVLQDRL
jgi:ABC-type uncharacterized transport system permease subunit